MLVCLIYALGCLVFRRRNWLMPGHGLRIPFLLAAGLVVGVAVEWIGARLLQRWVYAPSMPLVPGLELGLVPLVQMILLPTVVFPDRCRGARTENPRATMTARMAPDRAMLPCVGGNCSSCPMHKWQ